MGDKLIKKVCILTSRPVGQECIEWAKRNTPKQFEITESIENADILISVMFENIIRKRQMQNKSYIKTYYFIIQAVKK